MLMEGFLQASQSVLIYIFIIENIFITWGVGVCPSDGMGRSEDNFQLSLFFSHGS